MNISSRHGVEVMNVVVEVGRILTDILVPEGNGWIKITIRELW